MVKNCQEKMEVKPNVNKSDESSNECKVENVTDTKSTDTEKECQKQVVDEANLHYEDGLCIYTDPESKCQFTWDETKQEWVSRNSSVKDRDYDFNGETFTYIDKETKQEYLWDADTTEWKSPEEYVAKKRDNKEQKKSEEEDEESDEEDMEKRSPAEISKQDMTKGQYSYENDTHVYTDASDGSKYFWDKEKSAWFPKVDDDFIAQYQMNYGFVDNVSKEEETKPEPPPVPVEETLKRKAPQEPTWFEVGEESTKVYVSGLPLDITETEFVDFMQKCGLVMRDPDNNGKMKVKIYLDSETMLPKGDALCSYIKKESVELALNLLDGSEVRGHKIKVERAKFTMKGEAYDPKLKPKKRRKKDKEKLKKIQEKLLDWRPDKMRGERSRHENIVIIKNLFDPVLFNKDVKLILEYQQDLREECLKCGNVKKVIIYDRHPEGVAQVSFKEVEAADACVQLLNGRWFGQRKITAETWDGKTKYKMTETDEQIKARLEKWEKFLETEEATKEDSKEKNTQQEENQNGNKKNDVSNEDKNIKEEFNKKGEDERETEMEYKDSDQDTVSSVGSNYDTDEEMNVN